MLAHTVALVVPVGLQKTNKTLIKGYLLSTYLTLVKFIFCKPLFFDLCLMKTTLNITAVSFSSGEDQTAWSK